MKTRNKALTISLLVHASFVGCALALSGQAIPAKPAVVIDFNLEQALPGQATAAAPTGAKHDGAPEMAPHQETAVEKTAPAPSPKIREELAVQEKPVLAPKKMRVARKIKMQPKEEPVPAAPAVHFPLESSQPSPAIAAASAPGAAAQDSAPPQAASNHEGRSNGHEEASAGGRYVQGNYEYIRKHIMESLIYPAVAQKRGWRGKVLVSFVINEGGEVEDITIVTSCGHDLLDSNVISTIHKAAPFPKPPERAQIILPIVYDLKST